MDIKFKWNMFVTAFIPLWISIIVADVWDIVEDGMGYWSYKNGILFILNQIYQTKLVSILVVLVTFLMMLCSICSISRFIKEKRNHNELPKIKIKKAIRADKLSSEFLLAYILPMLAFDFTKLKSVFLFVIYFCVLAFLCIRNNNVYTNIWLEFKGYKMFLCDLETKRMSRTHIYTDCLVISKNNLTVKIDNDILGPGKGSRRLFFEVLVNIFGSRCSYIFRFSDVRG